MYLKVLQRVLTKCRKYLKIQNEVEKKFFEHGRTRTCNLPLRRRTRYPLRHAPDRVRQRIFRVYISKFSSIYQNSGHLGPTGFANLRFCEIE